MCLLTFFPAGVMPDEDALLRGAMYNDDGHGYAVVDMASPRIRTGRGLSAPEMIEEFAIIRARHLDGPALFHSRLATDGTVNLVNCHPFEIGGDPRTVLAHNGIMPLRPRKDDPRSDTRLVAEQWIPKAYGTLRRRRARLAFERWLTSYNKVVILTVDRRFRDHDGRHGDNAFILNEQSGVWENGIWYSNATYAPFDYKSHFSGTIVVGGSSTGATTTKRDKCWECGTEVNFRVRDYCPKCSVCFDCGYYPMGCTCYVPAHLRNAADGRPSQAVTLWRPTGTGGGFQTD